jgi:flagellar secretion chaperone FliS
MTHLHTRSAAAAERYRSLELSARMASATRYELVGILYESLDSALAAASAAVERDRTTVISIQLGRARSILVALEAGLDFESGGKLAELLASVYRAMQRRLGDVANQAEAIDEVRSGVRDLSRSWSALAIMGEGLAAAR